MTEQATVWRMHAHDDNGTLFHIGDRRYVELHGLRLPIVEVTVTEVGHDDPDGTHWGWLDVKESEPCMIWPSRSQYDMCFPYGPRAEEEAGKGRTLRLAVTTTTGNED